MISKVFVIKKVNINMGPILNVYGVMGVFCQMRSCKKHVTLCDLEPAGAGTVSCSCYSQLALFTTERQG